MSESGTSSQPLPNAPSFTSTTLFASIVVSTIYLTVFTILVVTCVF